MHTIQAKQDDHNTTMKTQANVQQHEWNQYVQTTQQSHVTVFFKKQSQKFTSSNQMAGVNMISEDRVQHQVVIKVSSQVKMINDQFKVRSRSQNRGSKGN